MSDVASLELPDVGSLQPPPDLPEVGSLTEAPAGNVPPLRASMQPGSFSQGVVARARNGDALTRTITKLGQGFATGYGDSFTGITADDQQTMIDAGIKPVTAGEIGTVGGTLRFYGQSLMAAASSIKAAVFSLYGGVQGAVEEGVTQAAKEAGAANPERVGAEAAGFTEFMASDAHVNTMLLSRAQYAEATRIAPNPATGGFYDQRIGPVPDHVEAAQQAATVASHYGVDIAPAITAAYDKGILPAEIFHDAKTNPTVLADLVEGRVPEAYPVSDWMGAEIAPEAAAKPAGAPATEGAPEMPAKAPIVPMRLRPIQGTGEMTPMQLSQSVEEAVGKVFDAVPVSRIAENAVQEAAARKFVDLDPERADQVAMYGTTPPKNLLGQMVFNEVLRRADEAGDFDKVRMLATQGAQSGMLRRFGQEVQAASRLGPEGEIAENIQQLQEKRVADLKAQGIDAPKAINDQVAESQQVTRAARSASASSGAWADLVNLITCKE